MRKGPMGEYHHLAFFIFETGYRQLLMTVIV